MCIMNGNNEMHSHVCQRPPAICLGIFSTASYLPDKKPIVYISKINTYMIIIIVPTVMSDNDLDLMREK